MVKWVRCACSQQARRASETELMGSVERATLLGLQEAAIIRGVSIVRQLPDDIELRMCATLMRLFPFA